MQRKLPNICKKKTAPTWRHKLHYTDDNRVGSFTNYATNQSGSWACHMLLLLCLCSVPDLNQKFDITIAPTMSSVCHYPDDRWTDSGREVGGWCAVKSKPHSALYLSRGEHDSHPSHDSQILHHFMNSHSKEPLLHESMTSYNQIL